MLCVCVDGWMGGCVDGWMDSIVCVCVCVVDTRVIVLCIPSCKGEGTI